MLYSRAAQRVPDTIFHVRDGSRWVDVRSVDVFAGRTVVCFALPGAFTPTCSSSHVPRYNELASTFNKLGIDEIVCVAVNDSFVMSAWQLDEKADQIRFLPDGNGTFTDAMGMLIDKADIGLGKRSWRYSMLVRDGLIEHMFIEEEGVGDPLMVSDADTMLRYLGGVAPPDILMVTRPGCSHCSRARALLRVHGLAWVELPSAPRILRALPGPRTTPAVFIDGEHVGTADDLAEWLGRSSAPPARSALAG